MDFAYQGSVFAMLNILESYVSTEIVKMTVMVMGNVIKEIVSVILDIVELVARTKFVKGIALKMEFVRMGFAPVMKVSLEKTVVYRCALITAMTMVFVLKVNVFAWKVSQGKLVKSKPAPRIALEMELV
eukprot:CAMPEP_0170534940 /NCGR_PEP_ID=MMETSP0209-20121228/96410_1 /TAXON_ID=665100 ORGANISM="Litonotus pictus, Strain P1" /NCGR_SAMPLE_ID=MMETSP0209 /ASSEMBLY_ACC=CAM_ASM_000301 /LENGTH=128 /DNA_ID=CAMNT_0010835207 /DNA_START=744 /DNA_END=1130 /DNA_ORIENTATION=-